MPNTLADELADARYASMTDAEAAAMFETG